MGQSISKRVVPRIQRAIQKMEHDTVKEALRNVNDQERKVISSTRLTEMVSAEDSSSDGEREQMSLHHRKDNEQDDFLRSQQADIPDEMPKDLIDFLNDMGPVQRAVDKNLTSARILEKIDEQGEGSEESVMKGMEDEQRKKRRQLWSTHTNTLLTATIPEDDHEQGRRPQLPHASIHQGGNPQRQQQQQQQQQQQLSESVENDSSSGGFSVEEEELKVIMKNILSGNDVEPEKMKGHPEILNALNFLSYPVIMRDTDDDLIGAWPSRVNDLRNMGLSIEATTKT